LRVDRCPNAQFNDTRDSNDALNVDPGTGSAASALCGTRATLRRDVPCRRSLRALGLERSTGLKDRCPGPEFDDLRDASRADCEDCGTFGRTLPTRLTETALSL
jgi:hypothetical protein